MTYRDFSFTCSFSCFGVIDYHARGTELYIGSGMNGEHYSKGGKSTGIIEYQSSREGLARCMGHSEPSGFFVYIYLSF